MLVSAKDMMEKARDGKYAVGQFNINNLEWTKAILNTAQKLNSPVILGVSGGAGKYMTGFKVVDGYHHKVPVHGCEAYVVFLKVSFSTLKISPIA